ncbi:MAG: sugar porter family MFS transporter [Bacteroidota bacterium]
MAKSRGYVYRISLIVALGGFLMGFDASVISGVVKFVELDFNLTKLQVGWAVSCLTLTATLAMLVAGPLSDRFGRRTVLRTAAILYSVSAIGSALAPNFASLVTARMIGGFGVGASLITAPMYIAEISPARIRGTMVSFNQLNIVLGISVAFFTNYLILRLGENPSAWVTYLGIDEYNWRWMLGLETLPAVLYFIFLLPVPESPRWLAMRGREEEALEIFERVTDQEQAKNILALLKKNLAEEKKEKSVPLKELFKPALRLVLVIGIVVAVTQQITGINAVFFYAPIIFEQTGIGMDAAFSQAIFVGLTNLVFTILALWLIDRLGRKFLLVIGLSGIIFFMGLLSLGFGKATYNLDSNDVEALKEKIESSHWYKIQDITYENDLSFKKAVSRNLGEEVLTKYWSDLIVRAININSWLILIGILGFVASFAISIGPVMWVLFSELFPNWIRGVAISFVGFINSGVSFLVQLVFPWELANLGNSATFMIFGVFGAIGLVFILFTLPETKGKTLEELEIILVK